MATRILIVDDDPKIVSLLSRQLSTHGYETVAASSAPEAIRMVRTGEPDLVLLDLDLPGMDGLQALEPLRAARRRKTGPLPIIVLTGMGDYETLIRLYRAGADYFVSKPYREDELLRGIRMALPVSGREMISAAATRSALRPQAG